MATKSLLIIYYSETDNTKKMAEEICKGARRPGLNVELKRVEECKLGDLVEADGVVIGSPTFFSNVAWQVKKLIDESITLYRKEQLKGKVGGCFASAGTRRDGKGCIRMLELAFGLHHEMKMIPGILKAEDDNEEETSKMCRQYGAELAKQITS